MDKEFIVRVKTSDIWPIEKPVLSIRLKCGDVDLACEQELVSVKPMGFARAVEFGLNHLLATENIAPVVHGVWGKHGKTRHKVCCPHCGSDRPYKKTEHGYFLAWESNFCPNCGARMDGEEND